MSENERTIETKNPSIRDMSRAEVTKRSLFLCLGLFVMAFGVSFSITSNLGVSPISSLPYVCSLALPLTVGQGTIVLHCVLIALQILILRKEYQLIQLIQFPFALVFGFLTDFALYILSVLEPSTYPQRWICCAVGIVVIAFGISMAVTSRISTLPGEGLVLAVCRVTHFRFPTLKVCFDVTLVILSCLFSLAYFRKLTGVREGTVAAAVFVGILTRRFNPWLLKLGQRIF